MNLRLPNENLLAGNITWHYRIIVSMSHHSFSPFAIRMEREFIHLHPEEIEEKTPWTLT
jgi:hypothetical protein